MATFSSLRSSRLERQPKSYVKSSAAEKKDPTTPVTQPVVSPAAGSKFTEKNIYSLPKDLEIRQAEKSGRGLFSKSNFKPGDVIISMKPFASALSNQYLQSHCSACFGPASPSGLKRCANCRAIYYCNLDCQKRDWPLHKDECVALQRWAESVPVPEFSVPNDAIRCLARLLQKRKQKGTDNAHVYQKIDGMQSPLLDGEALPPSAHDIHIHLSHSLVRFLRLASPKVELADFGIKSARELLDVLSRFVTNTFSITSPSLTPIGASISPEIALINHSCDPNAVVVFPRTEKSSEEPRMQVVALRPIGPDEEVLTSYIDTTLPKMQRQASLKETYHFDCGCFLCTAQVEVDPRQSIVCPKSCGGTSPFPTEETPLTRCVRCKAAVTDTDTILDSLRIGQEALDKASRLQFQDPAKSRQLTTNLIPILISAGLIPSSHPLLALSRLHQSLLISSLPSLATQEALDEIIRTATRSFTGLAALLHFGHPVRSVASTELGKMLAVDEPTPRQRAIPAEPAPYYPPSGPARLKLAYETLIRAREELLIGFGRQNEGGEVGRDVRDTLISLENEIGVWKQGVKNLLEDTPMSASFGGDFAGK